MSGNDLNVKIDANASGYEAAISRAQRATLNYDLSLKRLEADMMALQKSMDDDITAALGRQHDAMNRAGKAAFLFGAAIATGLVLAVNEAVKWESAWTGVTKTVDGSAAEMERLEGGLRNLATSLPATHEEIAAVAEAAGQLGIKRDAIIGFTKTMIDLSETTNLTADQAATDMARFANIMGTPQDEIDRLGASLVALGNDGASTEAGILSMAMRIAGAGAQLDLTEGEVMGLANALSSVGIEAEAGGSAISVVMKNMQVAVSKGGDGLEAFARVAGMSADEFAQLWGTNAAAGLDSFITGLGGIKSAGGDVITTLSDMGITQIRQSDALMRLAGAGDLLTDSLDLGNDAWTENSALIEEAAKRYATTEAEVQIARNALRDAAITAGEVLLPVLGAVADTLGDMLAAWQLLPGPMQTSAVIIAAVAAAVLLFGGAALIAIPKIAAFNTAVASLNAGALKTVGTRLGAMGSMMMGPWGIALAAGITTLGFFAAKHGDSARAVDALTATLDAQTGAITANSQEWAIKELSDSGALKTAKELGLNLADVTAAALGDADAISRVAAAHEEYRAAVQLSTDSTGKVSDDLLKEAPLWHEVDEAIAGTNLTLDEATGKWKLEAEAKGESTDKTKAAGAAQKGTTGAWEDGAAAAGDLTEEVKTLGDELETLSGNYLDNRDAGRAVRDSLRDIREAVKKYRKEHDGLKGAFRQGTDSGDEFAGMLDGLAKDYQNQIDTVERLTGSEEKVQAAYDRSRKNLIEVAMQLDMTKKEAKAYADQVLGTPDSVKTHFEVDTEAATTKLSLLSEKLDWITRPSKTRIDVTTTYSDAGFQTKGGLQEADGGIVQAFAGGGFSASGQYVDRVPQLRSGGGSIKWNEPETGWEAYISGKPGMEARNLDVWAEAGRRLGAIKYGDGGVHGALQQMFAGRASFGRSFGASAGSPQAAGRATHGGGGPHEIRGTLTIPGLGEGFIRGVIRSELDADRSFDEAMDGRDY